MAVPARFNHQPDFTKVQFNRKPSNIEPTEPLTVATACVCEDPEHRWTVAIHEDAWRINGITPVEMWTGDSET